MLIAIIPLRFSLSIYMDEAHCNIYKSHTLLCWTKKSIPKCNAQLNYLEVDPKWHRHYIDILFSKLPEIQSQPNWRCQGNQSSVNSSSSSHSFPTEPWKSSLKLEQSRREGTTMLNNNLSDLCNCQYDTQFHVENNKRGGKAQTLDLCNYPLKKWKWLLRWTITRSQTACGHFPLKYICTYMNTWPY